MYVWLALPLGGSWELWFPGQEAGCLLRPGVHYLYSCGGRPLLCREWRGWGGKSPLDLWIPASIKLTANILHDETYSNITRASWIADLHGKRGLMKCGRATGRGKVPGSANYKSVFCASVFLLLLSTPILLLPTRKCNFSGIGPFYQSR